jgi:hypothetical protein
MLANSREEIVEVFDALHNAVSRLAGLSFEVLTTPACPPRLSSPPACANWKPVPAQRVPAATPCCP